ncbi:MAG: ribokinase [Phycisphaerae bacterium]|nr:ribokinase [Phycisphaerae bacterium]
MALSDRPCVVVVGSINMDLVARSDRVPAPGETVLGGDFQTIPGGKGANQAVAVARLGARCSMIGRIGDDAFGKRMVAGLSEDGVNTDHILTTPGIASGVALIVVDASGQNAICVASGANYAVTPADVNAAEDAFAAADVCLVQLELPLPTVIHALRVCRRHNVEAILDPAPAPANPTPDLFKADILSPNESEAEMLLGSPGLSHDSEATARALAAKGAREVVLKLSGRGAGVLADGKFELIPGRPVDVVDSTAAGDAFTAALAVARARHRPLVEATRFANAAGALACTKFGAQPSMPTAKEVSALL